MNIGQVAAAAIVFGATVDLSAQVLIQPLLAEGQSLGTASGTVMVEAVVGVRTTPAGGLLAEVLVRDELDRLRRVAWGRHLRTGVWAVVFDPRELSGSPLLDDLNGPVAAAQQGAVCWSVHQERAGCGSLGRIGRTVAIGRGADELAAEFQPVLPGAGVVWRDFGGVGTTADGSTFWLGGYSVPGFGSVDRRGLFMVPIGEVEPAGVVVPGMIVAGWPSEARTVARVRGGEVAWNESSSLALVELEGDGSRSGHMVTAAPTLAAATIGGQRFGEGLAAVGRGVLAEERWLALGTPMMISNDSTVRYWTLTARTSAPEGSDEVVVIGGVAPGVDGVLYREGMTVDGLTLSGPVEHLTGNVTGNLAMVWRVDGGTRKALFVDSQAVLEQWDSVPLTAAGGTTVMGRLSNFPGQRGVAITPQDSTGGTRLYVVADVHPAGAEGVVTGRDGRVSVLYELLVYSPPSVNTCPADFNGVGGVTLQDLFDYLSAWFTQGKGADFNGSGSVTVQDIFDFLTAWFVGCA
ncbi:MAG: GC-type dockerin domain-anchored protein [Phycisphaerales bacterium]